MRQSPTRLRRVRPGMAAGAILAIVAAIVIGCGGGGDSTGVTSATNATATATTATATATTATATATTATATATTATATATTATAGTAGELPQNVVIYTEANGENTEVRYINPDGSGDTLYASLGGNFSGFGVDPTRQNVKIFGMRADGDAPVGIYRNTTLSATGATQIVAPTYTFVDQIQVSPDGTTVYYVAGIGDAGSHLYRVPFNGGTPTQIDEAETFHLNPAGTQIVYSQFVSATGAAEIFVRNVNATGAGTRITNNEFEDTLPQWNKQGTQMVFASNRRTGETYDLYTMSPTGANVVGVTATDDQDERGGSFNQAGDTIAYSALGGESGAGLYRLPAAGGTRTSIKLTDAILDSVYWTTPSGRSGRSSFSGVAKRRRGTNE